ncbi:MAG TPA: hypothetical protein VHF24_10135 [Acidimicrobiales bacterium]|nr:hypothetical protein [Acidimicrobiales bacterium]
MYQFAVVALLGLAVLKVVDLVEELVPGTARFRTLATFVLAVAAVVAIDYSVFAGFDITLRENTMGSWITGVIVGSLASVWHAVLSWLRSPERLTHDTTRPERARIAA